VLSLSHSLCLKQINKKIFKKKKKKRDFKKDKEYSIRNNDKNRVIPLCRKKKFIFVL